jgi:hypothetical protein
MSPPSTIPPYTAEEKRWLKKHWRDEFHFLLAYNLSIYDEEDREQGRLIARAMIEADDDDSGTPGAGG